MTALRQSSVIACHFLKCTPTLKEILSAMLPPFQSLVCWRWWWISVHCGALSQSWTATVSICTQTKAKTFGKKLIWSKTTKKTHGKNQSFLWLNSGRKKISPPHKMTCGITKVQCFVDLLVHTKSEHTSSFWNGHVHDLKNVCMNEYNCINHIYN